MASKILMKFFAILAVLVAGCPALFPTPTASPTPLPFSTVTAELVKDTRVEDKLVPYPGDTTVRFTFKEFPVYGNSGVINRDDKLEVDRLLKWTRTGLTGQERVSEVIFAASFKLTPGTIYDLRIISSRGVFIQAEGARLIGLGHGVGSGDPIATYRGVTFSLRI